MAWCCMWCLSCFKEKKTLTRHVEGKHKDATFNCEKCSFKTDRLDCLKRHKEGKHKKINYSCSECKFFSDRKDILARHSQLNHPKDPLALTPMDWAEEVEREDST